MMKFNKYSYYIIEKKNKNQGIYELYAYTDRKEFVKRWKKERNVSLFRITKVALDKEQIHNLTKEKMGEYLIELKGRTAYHGKIEDFSIITTKTEELNVTSLLYKHLISNLYDLCQLNPYDIKSKKHFDSLRFFRYVDAYDYLHGLNNKNFGDYITKHEPDLLAGFIYLYGDTLSERQ